MVLTKTISSVSRQRKRAVAWLHKKEATRFAQDATLLFPLLLLTSFELLCIGGTHSLFGILVFRCLKAYLLSIYVTQWLFLLLYIFLTELASELCSTLRTHTNPLTVVTLVQCFATLGKPLSIG
jgi:hypothetical protein